ncbi:LOW QUALITY PROTEIN: coiled-coil domain-containing protein 191 [Notolabrus celidotus]|uniref:LOW QUALITY PROTEIN: coiled-coil domain-containing protein 191 n=1 Tax=Notolabrus celidotus TaxID=1203425 RepID=UPI001490135C|nr:LOW QUALITY PROTEIN: coiled-coil domain-containing protein 191 [Notolabrus celidotus]
MLRGHIVITVEIKLFYLVRSSITKQMTSSGHNPHLFRWRSKTPANKVHVKYDDIDQWRKRVEKASECAVSEVFSQKKPRSGSHSLSMPLHSSEQLRDHDETYSEAQALLGDWLGSKLRLELELEEEDDLACPAGRRSPDALAGAQPAVLKYNNFEDLYNCLAEEEEQGAVSSFLQDLMEQELLDSGVIEDLALDVGQTRTKFRDPIVTMEARHLQVRENRTRREAEMQRKQREREAQRVAREEAQRGGRGEEMRRKQEARRQEEMVQQEMVRLRRQMEERRGLEQMVRQREKERGEGQRAARGLQPTPPLPTKQQLQDTEQLYRQEKTQTKVHMHDLQCLQRHFSGWYSVVLDRRLRLGKAMALCDWKRQLRVWRAWRAVVWAQRRQREVVKTEEELRAENRQCRLAAESDRKRLLRRCLCEWLLWCRMEKEQRELLSQQQETRRKMAALINAASAGKLEATETSKHQQVMAPPEAVSTQPERTNKEDHQGSGPLAPNTSAAQQKTTPVGAMTRPTQPWQVTRRHAAPTAAEVHSAQRKGGSDDVPGSNIRASSRYGKRHTVQQQIITQQRKLLREQQEQIARLKEEQSVVSLELEMEKTAQITQLSVLRGQRAKGYKADPAEHRAHTAPAVPEGLCAPQREAPSRQKFPHPIITAMEDRARQRAERRKEVVELKQRNEEKKLAELKAAEEQRKRGEEEEKHRAAERKREEKRQEKERKEEKQRQLKRHQKLLELARQHHHRNLLLRRGLAPWKRLIQLRQANIQLADGHHNLLLLRRCTRGWLQSARESLSEREASADQLYQHALLQRGLSCWKRLKDWRFIQEQRAERFYRARTLRRFLLALLDHVTQERLMERDRQELSQEHNNRRLLRRCLLTWRQLPSLLRKEREKEVRRERLGRRVAEVLPDFGSNPL